MTVIALFTFSMIFGVACASPGPTILALLARIIGKGSRGIPYFCAGLVFGDLVWLACAVFGLAALATTFQPVFIAIKYLGVAYLLFMAWKLWSAAPEPPTEVAPVRGEGARLALAGVTLTLGNPKTMLFYLAILPSVVSLADLTAIGFAELSAIVIAIYTVVLFSYVLAAARARRAFRSVRAIRLINRSAGTVMAGAAVAIAARQ